MELFACPVRLFTPDVTTWLSLFDATHQVTPTGWVASTLGAPGGVLDQPARDAEALDWIRRIKNRLLVEQLKAAPERRREPRG